MDKDNDLLAWNVATTIDDVVEALQKIEKRDCTEDVMETIQNAIVDLEGCVLSQFSQEDA